MPELTINATILVINLRGPGKHGGVMKNPELVTYGDRKFLTGIAAFSKGNWSNGQRMHVALDEIAMMVEFASEAEHEAKCKWARRRSRGFFARLRET